MKNNWVLQPTVPDSVVAEFGRPVAQSQLLYNRGLVSRTDAMAFLAPGRSDSHDPWLLPDMEAAVRRLRAAIADRELIGVFGDFDIDGISGTAVMIQALRGLEANVIAYLPDRESEGHGLSLEAVRSMAQRGASVLVTVDCGSTSDAGIQLAASLDMDTVITDHHIVPEAPPYPATALVNPKRPDSEYPFEHLTGVGTAYKLVQALYDAAGRDEPGELLEFTALGTIGDVGPLIGENRYFVAEGIRRMNAARSIGLRALSEVAGLGAKALDSSSLSFQIIPRLNAPGRLSDAGISLELLITKDPDQARSIAAQLDHLNSLRKTATDMGVRQAESQTRRRWGGSPPGIIMVGHRDWGYGIVGLIASRLAETYGRPAIAVAVGDLESRGSARSTPGINILDVIDGSGHLMTKYGGHAQAAGFTIPSDNLGELARAFESLSPDWAGGHRDPEIQIDLAADPSSVKSDLFSFTEQLAPFGEGNPQPRYMSQFMRVLDSRKVGAGDHLKLRLRDADQTWDAIGFRQGHRIVDAVVGSSIDVAYQMELNTWNGRTNLQLVIDDLTPSD